MPARAPIRIAVTLGDVNGIGPEIALRAAAHLTRGRNLQVILVGSERAAQTTADALNLPRPGPIEAPDDPSGGPVSIWQPPGSPSLRPRPGAVRADAAAAAAHWIRAATAACADGVFDALTTAPICKEGLALAGLAVPGHTELIAALTNTSRFAMMLCGGGLRVTLATRHLPLRKVPRAVTPAAILWAVELTAESLPWMGAADGDIAVCGLNPHAGDGGAMGTEEAEIIAPAIRALRRKGVRAVGPLAADTVFHDARAGRYAAVVAMYHDQGLAAFKTVAFDTGVNVTLGLPIVRTSPDHGTAFDLAGRGVARADSMIAALRLAASLARRPNPWARRTP